MKTIKKDNYIIVEDEKNDVLGFSEYLENRSYKKIKQENIVVDILKYGKLTLEELLSFLKLSNTHRGDNKSFVIVNDTIDIDDVPEELIVVPTMREAADMIQMEEIERELEAM